MTGHMTNRLGDVSHFKGEEGGERSSEGEGVFQKNYTLLKRHLTKSEKRD